MSVRIIGRGGLTVVDVTGEVGAWRDIVEYVAGHISMAEGFFRDERLALSVGDRKINAADLQLIHNALRGQNISVVALHTSNPSSYLLARDLGLEAVWEGPSPPPLRNEMGLKSTEAPQTLSLRPSGFSRPGSAPIGSGPLDSDPVSSGAAPGQHPATDRRPAPDSGELPHALGRWSQIAARYQQSRVDDPEAEISATQKQDPPSQSENRPYSEPAAVEDATHNDYAANLVPWSEAQAEDAEDAEPPPFVHRGTLRSGQSCRHAGTVVILGSTLR